ncbi:MAG: mechanosensitive ion channel [Desulfurococcales archaeon]|nr:mechanosensitive ion channel [Desulfurococcales archaeon]
MGSFDLGSLWSAFSQSEFVLRSLESLILLFIILILLDIFKKIILKIGRLSGADERALENTYKVVEITTLIITIFLILYLLTQQQVIVIFILAVVLVILASSWETIANIASYYAILLSRAVSIGEYVSLGECEGKIRKITVLYTIIDTPERTCTIPNRLFLSKAKTSVKEPVYAGFRIRIWGFEDLEIAEGILVKLSSRLQEALRGISAIPGESRLVIEEYSPDAVAITLLIPVAGYRLEPEKASFLMRELASILKEQGYPFNITVERDRAGKRWK